MLNVDSSGQFDWVRIFLSGGKKGKGLCRRWHIPLSLIPALINGTVLQSSDRLPELRETSRDENPCQLPSPIMSAQCLSDRDPPPEDLSGLLLKLYM